MRRSDVSFTGCPVAPEKQRFDNGWVSARLPMPTEIRNRAQTPASLAPAEKLGVRCVSSSSRNAAAPRKPDGEFATASWPLA